MLPKGTSKIWPAEWKDMYISISPIDAIYSESVLVSGSENGSDPAKLFEAGLELAPATENKILQSKNQSI